MIGEVSIGGVFVPLLLIHAMVALALTGFLTQLLQLVGFYRLIAYRPLVDLCLFVVLLGAIDLLPSPGSLI